MSRRRLGISLFVEDGLFKITDSNRRVAGLGLEMASAVQTVEGSTARPLNSLSG